MSRGGVVSLFAIPAKRLKRVLQFGVPFLSGTVSVTKEKCKLSSGVEIERARKENARGKASEKKARTEKGKEFCSREDL